MQVRRVRGLFVVILLTCAALPALAQRADTSKPPTRSPQEQQDIQALVQTVEVALLSDVGIQVPAPGTPPPQTPPAAKPLTLGAPDTTQGDVSIKWESNHFVKGQTDTYIPFTLILDRASVASGAALWIRVVNAEQAAAFATSITAPRPQGNNKNQPPVRTAFAWDNGSFVDVPEGGSCHAQFSSGRDSTSRTSPSRRRARLHLQRTSGTIATATTRTRRRRPLLQARSVCCVMRSRSRISRAQT
jgi:hypothetical protein